MASVAEKQKEAYYLRLHVLIMEAQKVLRAKFDTIIKPADLPNTLIRAKGTLDELKRDGFISSDHYKLLNPNPDSSKFDTTLLTCLLQNICNLNHKDKAWVEKDNAKLKGKTDQENIQRIRNLRNQMHHRNLASLEQHEFESSWNVLEQAMVDLGASCGLHDIQDTINHTRTKSLDKETAEMINLRENTLLFLEEYLDDKQYYVETKYFHQADNMLNEKYLTVLTGHPGEGKTTMAAYLALKRSKPENIVQLAHASDWRKVDLSMKMFNTVIIDDIFGAGALNTSLLLEWKMYLREIEQAAKTKRLNVIITSRHYIKEEALDDLNNTLIFQDKAGHIVHLASNDLTNKEMREILLSRAKRHTSEDMLLRNHVDIDACVLISKGKINRRIDKTENFVFGFPQCANLFVQSDMIKYGARFFENPEAHFKAYIEQMYNAKDNDIFHKFIALVIVWAEPTGRLKADDVRNPANASEHIKYVSSIFGIEVNRKFMENISSSLKSHQEDFLLYADHSGEYKFSHNVIGDMVGVVLGDARRKTVETIELCPRDFLMTRICLKGERNEEFCVVVGKDNYYHLYKKFANMFWRKDGNRIAAIHALEFRQPMLELIKILDYLDFGILDHPILYNSHFVVDIMKYINENEIKPDILNKLVTECCEQRQYFITNVVGFCFADIWMPQDANRAFVIDLLTSFLQNKVFVSRR